jgi:DNA helicase-2/ATP-dependent DNA helicase PcrA
MALDPDELLAGLDDQQRAAVVHPTVPLLIVAGAGSGKTRVLTRRIAWRCATQVDDPRRVLALTFTRAAATELQARLRLLGLRDGVRAGTFHAVAWAELRSLRAERGRPAPTLLDRPHRVLARLVPDGVNQRGVAELVAELSWARARLVPADRYAAVAAEAGRRPPIAPVEVAELAHRYAEEKRRRGLVDFDDLLEELALAIEHDPSTAATQRWRSTHLYVDEYQDLNPLQARLLDAWLGGAEPAGLCAVGDPNQAIYGWNGADPSLLERFAERHPGADTLAVDRSYRSSPEVLAVANALLDAGACGGVRLRAVRPEGPVPEVAGYDDDGHEARAVARSCIDLHVPGAPWSHQAVLARTNAQLDVVETALAEVGVPTRVRGRVAFADHPTVRAALRELQGVADFDATLAAIAAAEAADEHASRFVELADAYRRDERRPSAVGLRAWLATNVDGPIGNDGDGVELRTFHAAKGLEWPIVHVCGVEDGLVPIATARTPAAVAEERRLLHVAITRAERILRLTWAASRRFGDSDPVPRRPSPLLVELVPALDELRAGTAPADWREHLPRARPRRRPPAPVDHRLDALRAWRTRRARAAGIPPTAVLADHVLRALADADPDGPDEVAAVAGTGHLVAAGLVEDLLGALHGGA